MKDLDDIDKLVKLLYDLPQNPFSSGYNNGKEGLVLV